MLRFQALLAMAISMAGIMADSSSNLTSFKDMEFLKDVVDFANVNAQNTDPHSDDDYVQHYGGYHTDGDDCTDDDDYYYDPGFLHKQKSKSKGKKKFHGDTGIFFDIGIGLAAGDKGNNDWSDDGWSDDNYRGFSVEPPLNASNGTPFNRSNANFATIQGKGGPRVNKADGLEPPKKKSKKQKPKFEIGTGLFLDVEVEKGKKQKSAECEGDYCLSSGSDEESDHEKDKMVHAKSHRRVNPKQGSRKYRAKSQHTRASNRRKGGYSSDSEDWSDSDSDDEQGKKFWFWPMGAPSSDSTFPKSKVKEVDSSLLVSKSSAETHNLLTDHKAPSAYEIPSNNEQAQKESIYVISVDEEREYEGRRDTSVPQPSKESGLHKSRESSPRPQNETRHEGSENRPSPHTVAGRFRSDTGKHRSRYNTRTSSRTEKAANHSNRSGINWHHLHDYGNTAYSAKASVFGLAMGIAISGLI